MSEFSDSFHLRSDDLDEGVALLRRAGLEGFVFPSEGGWTTLVCEGDGERLVAENTGTLLRYQWARDHGCRVDAWSSQARLAMLEVNFEKPTSG